MLCFLSLFLVNVILYFFAFFLSFVHSFFLSFLLFLFSPYSFISPFSFLFINFSISFLEINLLIHYFSYSPLFYRFSPFNPHFFLQSNLVPSFILCYFFLFRLPYSSAFPPLALIKQPFHFTANKFERLLL